MSENHDPITGRFLPGNTASKLDFTKEMSKHVVKNEMNKIAAMLATTPMRVVAEVIKNDDLKENSVLMNVLVARAVCGDLKAIQWIVEAIIGKPKQQLEQENEDQDIRIVIDSDDAQL